MPDPGESPLAHRDLTLRGSTPDPVLPLRPQAAVRRRVRPRLGQAVPPEAQHVSPRPQPQVRQLRQPAQPPARTHQRPHVRRHPQRPDLPCTRHPPVDRPRSLSTLRRVLRHVRRHPLTRPRIRIPAPEFMDIHLHAEPKTPLPVGRRGRGHHRHGSDRRADRVHQDIAARPGRRQVPSPARTVQANDRVEVHHPTALVLRHLQSGHPHQPPHHRTPHTHQLCEPVIDRVPERLPQPPRMRVPQHVTRVVVALHTHRSTHEPTGLPMNPPASERLSVRAHPGPLTMAAPRPVHPAETRCRQRQEHGRVQLHVLRDTLAAGEPRVHQMPAVALMKPRARPAPRSTPIAAPQRQPLPGLTGRVVPTQ